MTRRPWRDNYNMALRRLANIKEKNTLEVGFRLQLFNLFSDFWPETDISLQIIEPN